MRRRAGLEEEGIMGKATLPRFLELHKILNRMSSVTYDMGLLINSLLRKTNLIHFQENTFFE